MSTINDKLAVELRKTISAHAQWKTRLQSAIVTGASDFHPATIRKDDQCEFGRFLHHQLPIADRAAAHGQSAIGLHARFHQEAGRILELALDGKKAEARTAMLLGSAYVDLSTRLVLTLMEWRATLAERV